MKETIETEFAILGAGLAGLMVADELIARQKSATLLDINSMGAGASSAPLVLINPATGRRAKMAWKAKECIDSATEVLKRVSKQAKEEIFIKNGVLRPALIEKMGEDFKRAPDKYDWPSSDWIQWLEKEELESNHTYLKNTFGGLFITEGFTINTRLFLELLFQQVKQKGLRSYLNQTYNIEYGDGSGHQIRLGDNTVLKTNHIIFAVGAGITEFEDWSYLPLERVKGQTLAIEFKDPLPLSHSISSMGYFAFDPKFPKQLVVGSTYEHHFDHENPDEKGKEYLIKKLDNTLPGYSSLIKSINQWSGVRITTQDHQPIIGSHYKNKGLHIITGLGSKGMIYSKYLSKELCNSLLDKKPISPQVNADRFL